MATRRRDASGQRGMVRGHATTLLAMQAQTQLRSEPLLSPKELESIQGVSLLLALSLLGKLEQDGELLFIVDDEQGRG